MDSLNGIKEIAYGLVVVKSVYEVRNVLTHINLYVPLLGVKLGLTVYEVGCEDSVEHTVCVCLIKFIKSVGKETEGSKCKYSLCSLFLDLHCNVDKMLLLKHSRMTR